MDDDFGIGDYINLGIGGTVAIISAVKGTPTNTTTTNGTVRTGAGANTGNNTMLILGAIGIVGFLLLRK